MNETCDHCGPAVYRAEGSGELYLCAHCARRLRKALHKKGWTVWPVARRRAAALIN
jgi:hypothetical protein